MTAPISARNMSHWVSQTSPWVPSEGEPAGCDHPHRHPDEQWRDLEDPGRPVVRMNGRQGQQGGAGKQQDDGLWMA
ncbi:MAG: hypothetical protein AABZ35_06675 [Gemmatimonadota bacterium]